MLALSAPSAKKRATTETLSPSSHGRALPPPLSEAHTFCCSRSNTPALMPGPPASRRQAPPATSAVARQEVVSPLPEHAMLENITRHATCRCRPCWRPSTSLQRPHALRLRLVYNGLRPQRAAGPPLMVAGKSAPLPEANPSGSEASPSYTSRPCDSSSEGGAEQAAELPLLGPLRMSRLDSHVFLPGLGVGLEPSDH